MKTHGLDETQDIVIIGVGPPALAALHDAEAAGLKAVGIDKGPVCGALVKHPPYMQWFSTYDKLELCGFPLLLNDKNPSRREYLKYCRTFARHHNLKINTYREVTRVEKDDDLFNVHARDHFGRQYTWRTKNVVVGTGFYDSPRPLNVPGEDLPHVSHIYSETHNYADHKIVIIGAGSSAAEIALELWRDHTEVTIVMRSATFHTKFWVEPDIENRIKEGSIVCYREANVTTIDENGVHITDDQGQEVFIEADFVLAMTGYQPNTSLLRSVGAEIEEATNKPVLTDGLQTTVSGLYVMGTLCAGIQSNVVFIENSRDHGTKIVQDILNK
jgi:putative YpdA family bacillithiol system oxidoreductase